MIINSDEKLYMHNNVTGIILSGGKSKRMGKNKALLKIGDKTIIELIHDKMSEIFKEVIVISNEPELYDFLGTKIYEDIHPGRGPISGIHSGLVNSTTDKNFVISCDMPLVKSELINFLLEVKSEKEVILPENNDYMQTLCGIYNKKRFPLIEG